MLEMFLDTVEKLKHVCFDAVASPPNPDICIIAFYLGVKQILRVMYLIECVAKPDFCEEVISEKVNSEMIICC